MVKKLTIAAVALFFGLSSYNEVKAQTYATAAGLRLGVSTGVTFKHFIKDDLALEGILHSKWRGLLITGLFEVHKNIREVRGLRWFYGGGAHIGSWNYRNRTPIEYQGRTVVGIDGIIGLDYMFDDLPLNLSLDYKPAFNLITSGGFWGTETALSVRYTF